LISGKNVGHRAAIPVKTETSISITTVLPQQSLPLSREIRSFRRVPIHYRTWRIVLHFRIICGRPYPILYVARGSDLFAKMGCNLRRVPSILPSLPSFPSLTSPSGANPLWGPTYLDLNPDKGLGERCKLPQRVRHKITHTKINNSSI